jgi:uncharacterized membrane protein YdjX (TVP38/TMEM64 family)
MSTETGRRRRLVLKGLLFLLVFGGISLTVYLLSRDDLLGQVRGVNAWIVSLGWAAPAAFVLFTAALTAIGFPRLLFCSLGGLAFGFAWGLVWSQLGALAGAFATFMFARRFGRRFALKKWPRLRNLARLLKQQGVVSVLLIRQLPLSSFHLNILLGLTPVKQKHFVLGSVLGFLPKAIPAALIGASVIQVDSARLIEYLILATVLFTAFGVLTWWLMLSPSSPVVKSRERKILLSLSEGEGS